MDIAPAEPRHILPQITARLTWRIANPFGVSESDVGKLEQLGLERGIGHFLGQRPAQAGSLETSDRRPAVDAATPI